MPSFKNFFGQDTLGEHQHRSLGAFGTLALWLGANVVVTTILTGMLLVPDLSFTTAMGTVALGSVIGAIPLLLVGLMGQRTGLPSMVLTRRAYGPLGSRLISLVNMCVLIAWSWIQALLAGMSLDYAIEATSGYSNLPLMTILCETVVVMVVLRGHLGIERVERWAALAMLVLAGIVLYQLNRHYELSALVEIPVESRNAITLGIAFDIVIATAFSWISSSADYNRNCKSGAIAIWGTWLGYVLAALIAMGLGAAISGLSIINGLEQTYDPTRLLAGFGFGLPAALVIFFSVMTTNVMAVYSATLSCMNVAPGMSFWKPALIIGVVTVFGALIPGILDQFQNFLLLIGALFIPAFSVMIADYYLVGREGYNTALLDARRQPGRPTAPIAIGAYLIGAALAAWWTLVTPLPFGASLPVFVITGGLYWLGVRVLTPSERDT
ncbi:purine-cytosine permease family protein [Kushneria indalinina]|uniref:Putative hydroxymethylpyrimidine transporter CytX n=1 Tax=Kushneria indalinina DSM 14324 TaxID=1122140 RepID=A0A3D9DWY5_9GAMM|nr:cytosine permease [Kushneria indalinina]REC95292.1 putative hydroxymethylpyrimidine transporter CytX [Kushneria indalinina DSM 14324]